MRPVGLVHFADELTAGRPDVRLQVKDISAIFDPILCSLILDNAISNAFKHGHPETPNVEMAIENIYQEAGLSLSLSLCVCVCVFLAVKGFRVHDLCGREGGPPKTAKCGVSGGIFSFTVEKEKRAVGI